MTARDETERSVSEGRDRGSRPPTFSFDDFDKMIDEALAAGPQRPLWSNAPFDCVDNDGVPIKPPKVATVEQVQVAYEEIHPMADWSLILTQRGPHLGREIEESHGPYLYDAYDYE